VSGVGVKDLLLEVSRLIIKDDTEEEVQRDL
jgi:hypothetical protein